jgi:hypothetical protein
MNTLTITKNLTMWTCEKYGTSMLSEHADAFCARRFAAAKQEGGAAVIGYLHCSTCSRGARMYMLRRANRGRNFSKKRPFSY